MGGVLWEGSYASSQSEAAGRGGAKVGALWLSRPDWGRLE